MPISIVCKITPQEYGSFYYRSVLHNSHKSFALYFLSSVLLSYIISILLVRDFPYIPMIAFFWAAFTLLAAAFAGYLSVKLRRKLAELVKSGVCEKASQTLTFYDGYLKSSKGKNNVPYAALRIVRKTKSVLVFRIGSGDNNFLVPRHCVTPEQEEEILRRLSTAAGAK